VAKINPVKIKQDADKEEKAGRFDKAIALHKQIVDDNPRDWNTIKKIGDLYAKLNRNKEAAQEYAKVADFYARDGFLLKAIALWKQIQKLDPGALEPYDHLGGLYAKQGLPVEAKGQYQILVDEYKKRGKLRDAGDALRKMAEIDPGDLKIRSLLADLYMRDGNVAKAIEEYVAIAEELNKKGHLAEALQVLEKGLKHDPKSARLRAELARIHLLQKNYDKAAQILEEAARQAPNDAPIQLKLGEAYLGAKKIEQAEGVFRRLLQQDPNDQDARILLGRVYILKGLFDQAFDQLLPVLDRLIDRKEGERAAQLLQQIVQRNDSHTKSLSKLVEVYRGLRKDSAVTQTYQQLSEAYIKDGQLDEAASVLEILVETDPQNEQHRSKLEFVRRGGSGRSAAAPKAAGFVQAPTGEFFEEDLELEAPTLEADLAPAPPAAAPAAAAKRAPGRPQIVPSGPLSDEDREFIDEHLAEGRVFRKYGLADKAIDQFDAIVSRFPDNPDARQELRDLFKEKGRNDAAAEQSLLLAEIAKLKGDAAAAKQHEADAAALSPAAAPPAAAPVAPAPAPAKAAAGPAVEEPAEVEIPVEVEEGGLETPEEPAPADELGALDLGVEEADLGQELSGGFIEEEEPAAPPEELDLALPEEPPAEELAAPAEEPPASAEQGPAFDEEALDLDTELRLEEPAPPPRPIPRPPAPAPKPVAARPSPVERPAPPPAQAPKAPSRIQPRAAARPKAPPPSLAVKKPLAAKAAPKTATKGTPPELQRALDEVESYVSLGFVDDAKEALVEIGARYPDHPAVAAKMAELGLVAEEEAAPADRAPLPADESDFGGMEDLVPDLPEDEDEPGPTPAPAASIEDPLAELGLEEPASEPAEAESSLLDFGEEPAPAESPEEAGGALDLGAELDGLFEAQAAVTEPPPEGDLLGTDLGDAGLADIFKEFKKGVDKQLGKEDYDTRYNLGIAYKEMGLVDEAIAEFQLAAKDENRLLECSSMLGICFLEKGMAKLAVKWFERGLAAPGRSEDEYQGLKYDLGTALEAAGETDKALTLYTDLYGQDANFRDVANKVRELRAALR
jgi:pilus assembly protein FimV